jgi:hypothetical protein
MCGMLQCALTFASGSTGSPAVEDQLPRVENVNNISSEVLASSLPPPSQVNGILPHVQLVVCYKCSNVMFRRKQVSCFSH